MRYRQRSVEVDVVQFTRLNQEKCAKFTNGRLKDITIPRCIDGVMTGLLTTMEGNSPIVEKVEEEDFILRDNDGNFFICKPDIFHKNYERVRFSDEDEVVKREMRKFVEDFERDKNKANIEEYLIDEDYEYDYSYREIGRMQNELYNKIVQYFILNDVDTHNVYSGDRITVIHKFLKEEFYV